MNPALEVTVHPNSDLVREHQDLMDRHVRKILRTFAKERLPGSLGVSILMNALALIFCNQVTGGRHRPLTHAEMADATKFLSGFDQAMLHYFAMFGTDQTAVVMVEKATG